MKMLPLIVSFVLLLLSTLTSPYPTHASCSINWTFKAISCDAVRAKLVSQINKWTGLSNCESGGEKCLYKLLNNTICEVVATHTTPKHHFVDMMTMKFFSEKTGKCVDFPQNPMNLRNRLITFEKRTDTATPGCKVEAYSRSEVWYAILDFGTNYCNLHNLITGSGLNETTSFSEDTSDSVCTEYSSANCEKY